MRGPVAVLVTAVAAASYLNWSHAAPCTAPTPACAAELPPSRPTSEKHRETPPAVKQPDPAKREALVSLHARTAKCMRAYAGAILRQGVTDEVAARLFVVSHCGKEMHEWTQREEGSTEEESFAILDGLAGAALDAQRRPSAPPSPPPKPARPKEPPIKYDAQQERRRGIYLSFYAQTVACMREAAVAGLRTGSRSRKDLSEFVAGACGGPFSTWLTASPPEGEGRPEKETRAFLIALAYEAINMALRGPDAIIVR